MLDKSSLPPLRPRPPEAHKGTFGHVLVLAGSRGMAGAACLTTLAALRSGAGLVTCATPASAQPIVAQRAISAMTLALPEREPGILDAAAAHAVLEPVLSKVTVLAAGPGLTTQPAVRTLLLRLLGESLGTTPAVLDADALNNLAAQRDTYTKQLPAERASILTPHPREFARLADCALAELRSAPEPQAVTFLADKPSVTLVLKSHVPRVVAAQGATCWQTPLSPNAGLAKGGTGDVLTGLLAGLVAQGYPPYDAARLAVYLHGLAGQACVERLGPEVMTAQDLLDDFTSAFRRYRNES